jgi:chemotaxis protein histidine kinase CheA
MTSIQDKMRDISARWAADAAPRLRTLSDMLRACASRSSFDAPAVAAILRLTHALAGGGGTMGFSEISALLLPLEERLDRARAAGALADDDRRAIADALDRLPALIRDLETFRA